MMSILTLGLIFMASGGLTFMLSLAKPGDETLFVLGACFIFIGVGFVLGGFYE